MNDTTTPATISRWPSQLVAMIRMELLALRRNPTAAVLVAGGPLVLGFPRLAGQSVDAVGEAASAARMAGTIGITAIIFVHHHLVTVYAARRQELVLKRLRTGLLSDRMILAGAAGGTAGIFVVQVMILAGFGLVALGLPAPANPLTVAAAVLLLAANMAAVSALVSVVSRSSEVAMMTTLPTMALFLATPGMLVPIGEFPEGVEAAAWFLPIGPFPELVREAWLGSSADGSDVGFVASSIAAAPGLAMMFSWLVVMAAALKHTFRWEPRHG